MAVLLRDPSSAEYGQVEFDLQEKILGVYGNRENDANLFRPDLADQQKVGFFGLDRTSQTEVTEILDIKEMTEVLQILLQDVATLKRDINFTKHVMQADYESKLQKKSLELYCRINERVTELEKMHEERVGTVRRAFRQQLSDGIARVSVLYNKNLQKRVKQEKSRHEGDAGKFEEKCKELQATIQRNESVIHMLKMQIQQLQNAQEPSIAESPSIGSERPSAVSPQTPSSAGVGKAMSLDSEPTTMVASTRPPSTQAAMKPVTRNKEVQVEESLHSKTPSVNHELEEMREELEEVSKKLQYTEDNLQSKEEENKDLNSQIQKLNDELTTAQMEKQQLSMEVDTFKNALEQDKAASQKMNAGIEKQRQEMMKMMEDKLKQAQLANSHAAEAEAKAKQQAEKEKMALLHDQERRLKEELAKEYADLLEEEKAKLAEALKGDSDVSRLRRSEQMLRDEVQRLKKEIEKIHRTWEKKFAILQQSLHALKDESYIRQQLQRQAATLHHAAVSYSVDSPLGIHPSKGNQSKRPLPDIPKYGKGMPSTVTPGGGLGGGEKDYISYTVSAPSGRGTALFSTDENQIMSENDREDMPADVVPLPERPPRSSMTIEEEPMGHVSKEMGRVIVVPHLSVQSGT